MNNQEKETYTYHEKCPNCNAINQALKQNCDYCGCSLIKSYSSFNSQSNLDYNRR